MNYKKVPQQINDVVGDNIAKLAQLFPAVVKDGEVDFEALREELGMFAEVGNEKYELAWVGKKQAVQSAQNDVVGKTLNYIADKSKNPDITDNLYIEGDNLDALKLLRQNYYGAIKVIFIDPPYNTGSDFIYNDNFEMTQEEVDKAEGNIDELGNRYTVNLKSQNKYHANWLNMMYPRLKVAKELLAEDGIIFISIDDNEYDNLKKISDEIFGATNHLITIHTQVRYPDKTLNEKNDWQPVMEYVLVYAKNSGSYSANKPAEEYSIDKFIFEFEELTEGETFFVKGRKVTVFKKDEWKLIKHKEPARNLLKETWVSGSIYSGTGNGTMVQNVIEPRVNLDGYGSLYKIDGLGEDGLGYRYFTGPQKEGATRSKMFTGIPVAKTDDMENGGAIKYKPIANFQDYAADFGNIRHEGGVAFNSGKKPLKMLKEFINYHKEKDIIVMDFFSGSASTAHAVMQLNAEDGGNRKFIMVQIPQEVEDGEFRTICELGQERIRRAGEKIRQDYPDKPVDIGFRVFAVADTNIKWNSLMDMGQLDVSQLESTPDLMDFMPNTKDIDVVYELMLRQRDVALSESVELLSDIGNRTYLYASSFLVCLETEVTESLVEKIAAIDPLPIKFIFRDSAFKDDIALKDETFRRLKALVEKNSGESKPTYTVEFI